MIGRRSLLLAGAALPASAYGQCVINAPAVDACLGGVRNAGPAGATLDLNFMFPGSLPPGITFTRASFATYTDASGVIQAAAVNQPRWDYANGVLRGLLIEEARTNLLSVSTISGGWTPTAVAVLGGNTVLPDGAVSTAALISPSDTTSTVHSLSASPATVAASGTYTVSAFFKAGTTNAYMQINLTGGTTAVPAAYFDLTAGTAVVGAGSLSRVCACHRQIRHDHAVFRRLVSLLAYCLIHE